MKTLHMKEALNKLLGKDEESFEVFCVSFKNACWTRNNNTSYRVGTVGHGKKRKKKSFF